MVNSARIRKFSKLTRREILTNLLAPLYANKLK